MNVQSRQTLLHITLAILAFGLIAVSCVVIQTLVPSQRAADLYGKMEIVYSDIPYGGYKEIRWTTWPVVIYRPDRATMESLRASNKDVWGPNIDSTKPPAAFVYVPVSTYLGCRLTYKENDTERNRPTGWYDFCHKGAWDLSGRAYKNVNLGGSVHLENLRTLSVTRIDEDRIEIHR